MTAEPPLLPATSLHALLAGFRELGLDTARIAASLEDLPPAEAGTLVPAALYKKAWWEAGHAYGKPALATATGLAVPFGAFGMVDYLCGSAATVARGFESLVLHYRLVALDNRVELEAIPGGWRVAVRPLVTMEPHVDEFTLAVLVGRFRRLTDGALTPSRLLLRGGWTESAERTALLGCPVLGRQSVSALEIGASQWKIPITRADPVLHSMLARMAAGKLSRGVNRTPLETALRARLRDALDDGDADVARMARLRACRYARSSAALPGKAAASRHWWTTSVARNPCACCPTRQCRCPWWLAGWAMPSRPPSPGPLSVGMTPRPASGAGRRMHHRPWADRGLERLSGPHFGAPPDLSRAASPSSPAF